MFLDANSRPTISFVSGYIYIIRCINDALFSSPEKRSLSCVYTVDILQDMEVSSDLTFGVLRAMLHHTASIRNPAILRCLKESA